jgi:general secretion pathway protein E
MGIEPYLLASTLSGVLAQRLVRKLAPDAKRERAPTEAEREILAASINPAYQKLARVFEPVEGIAPNVTGYRGRTGIYELLTVDENVRKLIHDAASERELSEAAIRGGMTPLREDGFRWVADGVTSMEEVLRVTRD